MKNLLKITLSLNGRIFAECNNSKMELFSSTMSRKFTFEGVKFYEIVEQELMYDAESIEVSIYIYDVYDEIDGCKYSFNLLYEDYSTMDKNLDKWWIKGKIIPIQEEGWLHCYDYDQYFIDVYNLWQKGRTIDWSTLDGQSSLKSSYIDACLNYSRIKSQIIDKQLYTIDMSLIKEEDDFYIYAGKVFFGDRGYIGWSLHTFDDCLLTVYHARGYFYNKTILFTNTEKIVDEEIQLFFEEVKTIFLKYKFSVEESSYNPLLNE